MIILKARKRVYPTHLIFAIGTLFYATLMVVSNGKEFFIPFFACLAGFVFFTALFYGEEVIVDGHRLIVRRFFFRKTYDLADLAGVSSRVGFSGFRDRFRPYKRLELRFNCGDLAIISVGLFPEKNISSFTEFLEAQRCEGPASESTKNS